MCILLFKNWKINTLSSKSRQTEKAKSSHFDRTRGFKNQIFPTWFVRQRSDPSLETNVFCAISRFDILKWFSIVKLHKCYHFISESGGFFFWIQDTALQHKPQILYRMMKLSFFFWGPSLLFFVQFQVDMTHTQYSTEKPQEDFQNTTDIAFNQDNET